MNDFAKRLNQAMEEREVSQKELAEAIGAVKSSVSQYLSGRSVPRADVQKRIAEYLDCSVEWLNSKVEASDQSDIGLRKISTKQCARLLGKSEQFVRNSLQDRTAPFGFATRHRTKYSYHISPKKLMEYIGSLEV